VRVFSRGSALIRRFPFLPGATVAISGLALVFALMSHTGVDIAFAAILALAASAFVWGYSRRALKHALWPPLNHLQRRSYREVWDSIAISRETADVAVSGEPDEAGLRASARPTVRNIVELTAMTSHDDVLEIGCGVARIGYELASHCRTWTGADISANLLQYARERIVGFKNLSVVHLSEAALTEIPGSSLDVVYATNVFPHLDEIDRWKYVQEAFRVLRPGGRLFIDNVDLESSAGWTMFSNDAARFARLERPPYMPRYSTEAELAAYATHAGFQNVKAHHRSPLVIVTASKPGTNP